MTLTLTLALAPVLTLTLVLDLVLVLALGATCLSPDSRNPSDLDPRPSSVETEPVGSWTPSLEPLGSPSLVRISNRLDSGHPVLLGQRPKVVHDCSECRTESGWQAVPGADLTREPFT